MRSVQVAVIIFSAFVVSSCTQSGTPDLGEVDLGQRGQVFYDQSTPTPPTLSQRAILAVAKAENSALEFGQPNVAYPWSINETSGGTVRASEPFRVGGRECRRLVYETVAASSIQRSELTVCKTADASWRAVK